MISLNSLNVGLQYLLPQHTLSRCVGLLANNRRIKNQFIKFFLSRYPVNMSEALEPDPLRYATFNDFFVRKLKPDLRPIATQGIVSPVDGTLATCGPIEQGKLYQAKNHDFRLIDLLGGHADHAKLFTDGHFATFYLHPVDYHRVHMPYPGKLTAMTYIPGKLFSVQPAVLQRIPNIFARNERVVTLFETDMGAMAIILVGAIIVANIHISWHGRVPFTKQMQQWDYRQENIALTYGQEMGYFCLGSTVIVLFNNPEISWQKTAETTVKYGEMVAESAAIKPVCKSGG